MERGGVFFEEYLDRIVARLHVLDFVIPFGIGHGTIIGALHGDLGESKRLTGSGVLDLTGDHTGLGQYPAEGQQHHAQ